LQDESHSISCEQLTIEDVSSKSEISEELVTSQHPDNLSDQLSQHSSLSYKKDSQVINGNDSENAISEPLKISLNNYPSSHLKILPCSNDRLCAKLENFAYSTQLRSTPPFYKPLAAMPYLYQAPIPNYSTSQKLSTGPSG